LLPIALGGAGVELLAREPHDVVAEDLLLFGEREVHQLVSFNARPSSLTQRDAIRDRP
jgi:hypothetical protein